MANHDLISLLSRLVAPTLVLALSGCMMWMRDPEFYATEINEMLEARNDAVAACYDRFLAEQDAKARGALVVEFDVLKSSGELTNIEVDAEKSTVPDALAACVTDEMAQMRFEPADAKTAHATASWEFVLGSRKRPPPDPFAGVQAAVLACYTTHLEKVDREAQGDLVIDYAFNLESGAIERVVVVEESTTAPKPVVECATPVLSSARVEPEQLDERNAAGRRSFALRFEPYQQAG